MTSMAAATALTAIYSPKNCLVINSAKNPSSSKHSSFPIPEPLKLSSKPELSASLAKHAAIAGTVLSTLTTSPLALAAKQIAESPQQDNRSLALLLPVIPAIGWVLYNILGPALNQLNRMRSEKGVILGLGLGGLAAASSALSVPSVSAATEAVENGGGNNSGLLALFVAAAVFLEVLLFSTTMKSESEEKGASE